MGKLHISSTPHIHQKGSSTRNVMRDVAIAMIPAAIAGVIIFGFDAILTIMTCVLCAVFAEFLFNVISKKSKLNAVVFIGSAISVIALALMWISTSADKIITSSILKDVLTIADFMPDLLHSVLYYVAGAFGAIIALVAILVLTMKRHNGKQTTSDYSAIVTGLLLALNLSTNVPLWQCVIGSVFAIVVVKCFFGGLGKNIVNPAIAARVFLLLAFSATVAGGAAPIAAELTSSATPLVTLNQGAAASESIKIIDLFLGNHAGAIGETCALALLIGFIYLVARKVIKWYVPATFVVTVLICYLVFGGANEIPVIIETVVSGKVGLVEILTMLIKSAINVISYSAKHVLAGGLLLGAIFMATDYVTTPITGKGRILFCVGAGLLTFAIRQWGSYPEGVSIAILTMNLVTPFISSWTKKKTLGGVK